MADRRGGNPQRAQARHRRRRRRAAAAPRRRLRAAGREVFVLALEGAAEPATVEGVAHAWCRLGAAARGLALLRENNVTELMLAGGVRAAFA